MSTCELDIRPLALVTSLGRVRCELTGLPFGWYNISIDRMRFSGSRLGAEPSSNSQPRLQRKTKRASNRSDLDWCQNAPGLDAAQRRCLVTIVHRKLHDHNVGIWWDMLLHTARPSTSQSLCVDTNSMRCS